MLTIGSMMAGQEIGLQAGMEIHAAVREHFIDTEGGHLCKLCGDKVPHPRAAAAHMGKFHRAELEAYGTSEGASKGWDTRGRNPNAHASVLKKAGFQYRGKQGSGRFALHRYSAVTENPRHDKDDGGFGKNLFHNVWVDEHSGSWGHEASLNRSNMAQGRSHGGGSDSLDKYLSSGRFKNSPSMERTGRVWEKLR